MAKDVFEYDVAVSYADEDRRAAEELIDSLAGRRMKVLRDEYQAANAEGWGKDPVDHIVNLYARKARYCVLLFSTHYPLKAWGEAERTAARERALRDADEFILPVLLDDTDVPGLTEERRLAGGSMEEIVNALEEKLRQMDARSGPPSQSHDLRSGNVPSAADPEEQGGA